MITPLPGATPLKPGSASLPFFGVEPVVGAPLRVHTESHDSPYKYLTALKSDAVQTAGTLPFVLESRRLRRSLVHGFDYGGSYEH